ncbi:hypothetical protein [Lacibacter sp. H407]|uniref:hypothetical protein n=1 Tax=Lacibacter sp. H407 TaxID=3133423 RepID=UPI0030C3233F
MKEIILFLLLSFNTITTFSQLTAELCGENEKVIFAFQLQNKKWVSVCMEKNEKYIAYRFGTKTNIELVYPETLDSTSWQKFRFKGYSRGGGKQNAAMNYAFLSFHNNEAQYEIYETWNSEDEKEYCGITVINNNKTFDKKGILKTRKGYLLSLRSNEKIKPEED